ncbi:MAG TPA: TolC family protein, partial [Rubrivivax sp.]|nr:TolC family protein [Rubrivivax sp.]
AVSAYRAAVRNALREVQAALITLHATALRIGDTAQSIEGFDASLRAADARFRGGLGSLFDLEDARRSALLAQSTLVELQREQVAAWINLYRALGGGFSRGAGLAAAASAPVQ